MSEQLIITRPRQIGKMKEWVKQLRPEVKIEESDCQKNLKLLLEACKASQKWLCENVRATSRPASLDKLLLDAIAIAEQS